jgi:hypothetical protein
LLFWQRAVEAYSAALADSAALLPETADTGAAMALAVALGGWWGAGPAEDTEARKLQPCLSNRS